MYSEPYAVAVPQAALDDLRERIRRTRWPDPAPGEPWSQGTDLDYLRGLLAYWADAFDWRAQERQLNRYEHRVAEVEAVRIHFVHHRGAGGGVPLVLTHGWPSTFVELLTLVDRLGDQFDLVVPSLPGYAFSQRPPRTGVDRAFVARLWRRLMQGLGYERYGAYGGDFGAGVATHMALSQPDRMIGIHLSTPEMWPYTGPGAPPLSAEEQAYVDHVARWEITAGTTFGLRAEAGRACSLGWRGRWQADWRVDRWGVMAGRLWMGVLGSFELTENGRAVVVPARQRVVLAALIVSANKPVPVWRLLAYVWPGESPMNGRNALQTLVARLRRQIGSATIETVPGGYLLRAGPDTVDLLRFRQLVASGDDPATELARLREALALWRGNPLDEVPSVELRDEAVPGLFELWFAALERRLDLDLDGGRYREIVGELRELTQSYPLRESLWRRLMLALYRSGRRAEALEAFRTVSRRTRDQLGLDVGRELAELHQAILSDEAGLAGPPSFLVTPAPPRGAGASGAWDIPRQLPSDIHGFIGRKNDIAGLDRLIDQPLSAVGMPVGHEPGPVPAGRPVVISAIDGAAGIGKTALAVHWAHQVKHLFPDGQLFLNLGGYGPGAPMSSQDALETMLRSLGLPADRIPAGQDERSALLRSELANRRMLILLDNARDSEQVRPLLPGNDSLVLVTSRRWLRGLAVREGAQHLTLDLLPPPEALALLATAIGQNRVDREPDAAMGVVELCARLPLAVRLAAEHAARYPHWPLSDLLAELAGQRDRLAALSVEERNDVDLRSVFAWSYDALDPAAARMFQLLGTYCGDDISTSAAAALAGHPVSEATTVLGQLVEVSMLERRAPGRYGFHDLLRQFAEDRAEHSGIDRRAAVGRLLDWYVYTALNARARLTRTPHRMPIAEVPPEGVRPLEFANERSALDWFDQERQTIVRLVDYAAELGHHERVVVLAALSWIYLYQRGLWREMQAMGESSVRLAMAAGHTYLEGKWRNGLGAVYGRLGRLDDEIETSRIALRIFERLGDRYEQATSLLNLGAAYGAQGRFAEARDDSLRAYELWLEAGDPMSAAMALNNVAEAYRELGEYANALDCAQRAATTVREGGESSRAVNGVETIAKIHAAAGDPPAAIRTYREALALAEATKTTRMTIPIRVNLGRQLLVAGDRDEALQLWREAYELAVVHGEQVAEEIRQLLVEHGPPAAR